MGLLNNGVVFIIVQFCLKRNKYPAACLLANCYQMEDDALDKFYQCPGTVATGRIRNLSGICVNEADLVQNP